MLESISSKTTTGIASASASTVFSASIRRDSSPLEAMRRSGWLFSPALAENMNSILSMPEGQGGISEKSTARVHLAKPIAPSLP